jgi:phosphonate transport system substrate-binding protein
MNTSGLANGATRLGLAVVSMALLTSCGILPLTNPAAEGETAAATPSTAAAAGCAPEFAEIDFGIISTESQSNLQPLWEPFLADLSVALGRPVNGFYAIDYAGVIEAMGAGKVQLAWYGGKAYIEAAKRADAEAFAQTVARDGSRGYYAYLITHQANPILAAIDVEAGNGDQYIIQHAADLTLAFNDPNSTSGFLVPNYYVFAQQGVIPEMAFREVIFAGSHEATAQAVANDQVDVATNNSEALARLQASDPEAFEQIQIIWTSPLIPRDPIAYQATLPDCLKAQLRAFFYNYEDGATLAALGWARFAPADDADWHPIRVLDIAQQKVAIKHATALSTAAKTAKLEALDQQLEDLKSAAN